MKVLLLEDVDNLGLAGDVVAVADGFGRNYLIPRGFAQLASPGALKRASQVRKAGERKRARELASAQAMAQQIQALTLTFRARAGETGKLYGSVTTAELAEALERELGQEFDRRKIISDPLRQLGEHSVKVRLMADVSAALKVVIQPEEGHLEELPPGEVEAEVEETPQVEAASAESEETDQEAS